MVERGRKFSRPQPEVNIQVAQSACKNVVNLKQAQDFLAGMGVPVVNYHNLLHADRKVRKGIEHLPKDRMEENLREHCATVRNTVGYVGDIVW